MFFKDLRKELAEYKDKLSIKENELLKLTAQSAERNARLEALGEKLETQIFEM